MMYPNNYGAYTLLESIGQGGMSEIDLAQTTVSDANYVRFLVIKRIQNKFSENDAFVRMFQDEARINAELQHANIAQVYEFGQVKDEFFIAMEYIPGVDVREVQKNIVKQGRFIPIRITLKILADVLDGLHYAHNRVDTFGQPMHVVHRDVNPRNVMLSTRGEVKLIDFGVAKADTKVDKTVGHTLKGKFAYMAPEQIDGESIVDGRADLFAVTLMLHEMVENKRPFAKMNEVQIMHRILSGNIPKLEGPHDHPNPEVIRAIHQKGLQTHADDRYLSAKAMREALIEAAKPIGGIASSEELAQFLNDVIPDTMTDISSRLENYRKEITNSHIIAQKNKSMQEEATLVVDGNKSNAQKGNGAAIWLAVSLTLLVAIGGLVVWMWLQGDQDKTSNVAIDAAQGNGQSDGQTKTKSPIEGRKKATDSTATPAMKNETSKTVKTNQKRTENKRSESKSKSKKENRKKNKSNSAKTEASNVEKKTKAIDKPAGVSEQVPVKKEDPKEAEPTNQFKRSTFFTVTNKQKLILFVDGQKMGSIPGQFKIAVGKRKIKAVEPSSNLSYSKTIQVKQKGRNMVRIPELK